MSSRAVLKAHCGPDAQTVAQGGRRDTPLKCCFLASNYRSKKTSAGSPEPSQPSSAEISKHRHLLLLTECHRTGNHKAHVRTTARSNGNFQSRLQIIGTFLHTGQTPMIRGLASTQDVWIYTPAVIDYIQSQSRRFKADFCSNL
jgi:hypothetical protein